MKPTWSQSAALGLGVLALLCWVVMFLAGTDIWHDLGRPDFAHLQGPPYADLRAVVCAFYLLFFVLVADLIVVVRGLAGEQRDGPPRTTASRDRSIA